MHNQLFMVQILNGFFHCFPELGLVNRLQQIGTNPLLHGPPRVSKVPIPRQNNSSDCKALTLNFFQKLQAVHPRHPNIRNDNIGRRSVHHFQRFRTVAGFPDNFADVPGVKQHSKMLAYLRFVIHNQDAHALPPSAKEFSWS